MKKIDWNSDEALRMKVDVLTANMGALAFGVKRKAEGKVAKQALLMSPYFYNGRMNHVHVKSVGCGVYDVWVEET